MQDPISLVNNLRDEYHLSGVIALDTPCQSKYVLIMIDQLALEYRHVLTFVLVCQTRMHCQESRFFILHG